MREFSLLDPALGDTVEPSAEGPKARRGRRPKVDFVAPLQAFYVQIGMGLAAFPKWRPVGLAVMNDSEQIATAWNEWAKQSETIRKSLESFVKVSAGGAVVAAHMRIVLAVLAVRGVIPSDAAANLGVPVPSNGSQQTGHESSNVE